jgi:hypothetical protein
MKAAGHNTALPRLNTAQNGPQPDATVHSLKLIRSTAIDRSQDKRTGRMASCAILSYFVASYFALASGLISDPVQFLVDAIP